MLNFSRRFGFVFKHSAQNNWQLNLKSWMLKISSYMMIRQSLKKLQSDVRAGLKRYNIMYS